MNFKTRMLTLFAAGAIVFTGLAGAISSASAQEPVPGTEQAAPTRDERRDTFLSRVAVKRNVTLEQLKQAFKDAALETVDEAVANGRIDEGQAQNLRDRINNGDGKGVGRFIREHRAEKRQAKRMAKVRRSLVESAAAAIGISGDDLRAELKAGKSVADVAAEQGVSLDAVKTSITTDAKTKLDALVAEGKLSRERADQALQKLVDKLDELLAKTKTAAPAP